MANLKALENPATTLSTYQGVVVDSGGGVLVVNVGGNPLPAQWADPLIVAPGDPVLVEISHGQAFVLCRLSPNARPGSGTVTTVPVGSQTISVTGTDGVAYAATFLASYTPAVNDIVTLAWYAALPEVIGKAGTVAVPPPPPPPPVTVPVNPPPAPPQVGSTSFHATDSGTIWTPGGWGSWAGGGGKVIQGGAAYGGPVQGAFFYNNGPKSLAGRTITRIRFRTGARLNIGNYNSPATFHFYFHTSPTRPSGDVSRTLGPFDVTINPGAGPQTIDLSTAGGAVLLAGGGVSIAGEPYAGMAGRDTQPDAGNLILDWSR